MNPALHPEASGPALSAPPLSAPPLSDDERSLIEAWLEGQGAVDAEVRSTIPVRATASSALASHGQEQIWFHSQLAGSQPIYNEPVTVHYRGALDVDILRKSFNAFIQRHEAWRTTFAFQDGVLRQVIHPRMDLPIPVSDLSALPEAKREPRATELARKDALLPFDLSSGPMVRCRLVRLTPVLHRLYICLHHIIFDGVALHDIFLPELIEFYRAYSSGAEPSLPALKIQYGDYAEWHRRWVSTPEIAAQAEAWKSALRGMREISLPTDRPRAKLQSFRGSMERFSLTRAAADRLKEIGGRVNATLFMVLTSILAAQVKIWTGADDIPIGSAASGRKWSETEGVMGFFLNTIVLRIDTSNDPSFIQLIERVRETVLTAIAQDELPFPSVVQKVQERRDPSKHPLFQIMFSLEPLLPELASGWEFTQMDVEMGIAKFDLHLEMDERPEGLLARFLYNTDLFDRPAVRWLAKEWRRIALEVAARPDARISQLIPRPGKLRERIRSLFSTASSLG